MDNTETKPRIIATLKSITDDHETNNCLATVQIDITESNIKALADFGYVVSNPDFLEFEFVIPTHEELNSSNLGEFLCSTALWLIGMSSDYIVKRELSRILMEFYTRIEDGRE